MATDTDIVVALFVGLVLFLIVAAIVCRTGRDDR